MAENIKINPPTKPDPFDPKNFSGIRINDRFAKQRAAILQYYVETYDRSPGETRDPKEVKKNINELIEAKKLFIPTNDEAKIFEKSEGKNSFDETLKRWKEIAVYETISTLHKLGKIDAPERNY